MFDGTLIYYDNTNDVTVFKSTIDKDIKKFKSKYPSSAVVKESESYIEGKIKGKHIMIPKYKSNEYKQSLVDKMNGKVDNEE